MWNWLRGLFSANRKTSKTSKTMAADESCQYISLSQLHVEPDDGEDFDVEACQNLISKLAELGAETTGDVSVPGNTFCVSLEDFFVGNRTKHSIAANVIPAAPYDTAESWFALLKRVRQTPGVNKVVVAIGMIEEYEDGRLGIWPYADTIWIYSSLGLEAVERLVASLEPDDVCDVLAPKATWDRTPPYPVPLGVRPYMVWWD